MSVTAGLATRLTTGLYKLTGGVLGARIGKAPLLLLTTTGARTGRRRTVPLVHVEEAGRLVIAAANGGRPEHPGWFHNLVADPRATVQIGSRTRLYEARGVDEDERDALWARLVAVYPRYADHERKAKRTIPLVVLEPPDGSSS